MKTYRGSWLFRVGALIVCVLGVNAFGSSAPQYVLTNDDAAFPFLTGVTFYTVGANGLPVLLKQLPTGGFGIGGGYFGSNRISVLNTTDQQCIYAAEAANDDIVGISVNTLTLGGSASGSATDGGTSNGIGLAMNATYLYASFTDSNTIGTFAVGSGCSLTFLSDTAVSGKQGGIINAMAVRGNILVATYTDGSIESFDISGGTPVSHGDKQFSSATLKSQYSTYPNSIDITSDGHFAIFGGTSTTVVVEVSDISSGKLAKTVSYGFSGSISSSNLMLSPDETLLYVVNTQGDTVTALFFDKNTGTVSTGCTSGKLRGQSQGWSYLGGAALVSQTGNGGGVYVAEFGANSGIALVTLTASGQTCSMQEAPKSPVADLNSPGLLSIGTFPPRSF